MTAAQAAGGAYSLVRPPKKWPCGAELVLIDSTPPTPPRKPPKPPVKPSWPVLSGKLTRNGTLAPEERARRAEAARKAYFAQLAHKSAKARRRRPPKAKDGAAHV